MLMLRTPGDSDRWYWISPPLPLQMHFYGSRAPAINLAWIELIMQSANSSEGMRLLPEPDVVARRD